MKQDRENILFIAYNFPPMGGPGVQRSTRFVSYLREFGYEPIVLTITEEDLRKMDVKLDPSLMEFIPDDILIKRYPAGIKFHLIHLLQRARLFRLAWYFFFPYFWERGARWPKTVKQEALRLIQEFNIRLVYTSSAPYSCAVLGKMLKKKANIKWVADLRDPYTDAYAWAFPSKIHWWFCRRMEKKILRQSDILIVNTPEVKKLYERRNICPPDKIKVITNGF